MRIKECLPENHTAVIKRNKKKLEKAVKDGLITKKQMDKMPIRSITK
jgi:uncharacterized membrane-anchored protein YjiN (DUF445 family)